MARRLRQWPPSPTRLNEGRVRARTGDLVQCSVLTPHRPADVLAGGYLELPVQVSPGRGCIHGVGVPARV